jgi:hypothetical protein
MEQGEFTSIFTARPQNFAWFLGAGASATAGLPTATDILWDLKRRYYSREENQDVSRQDIQNDSVRDRIQAFMESRGFPQPWAPNEYPAYFEKIFGADRERQRAYISKILSEDRVTLSVGNRVLGALLSSGRTRICFTTNFDSVVEKAVAVVGERSLSAFHLEGPHMAAQALNNEEFPIYCKLHGDFRYDSIKNLPADLARQNDELAKCLTIAAGRFGIVVTGYSGRDESIMALFRSALEQNNAFPHGLYWTGIKGSPVLPAVELLLTSARKKGVKAAYVPIETFDALLLRLWRNIDDKPPKLDAKVRKAQAASVAIPLPAAGTGKPLIRVNALPIVSMPRKCLELQFTGSKDWSELRKVRDAADNQLLLTKGNAVWAWGSQDYIKKAFGRDLSRIVAADIPAGFRDPGNLHFKALEEEALSLALIRGKPLLRRTVHSSTYLIVDPHAEDKSPLEPLKNIVRKTSGNIPGLFTPVTEFHPKPEQVTWSEAVHIAVDVRAGRYWLLLDPDVWIWPARARELAKEFLDDRRKDRFNKKYNELLDSWIALTLGLTARNAEISVTPFEAGDEVENPVFRIATRTGYARRMTA